MELELVNFIRKNKNWEDLLKRSPYKVIVKRKDGYVIFNYTLGGSDFGEAYDILRECRGIILDELNNYEPVCIPFFKFFNYGEPYAEGIDWRNAKVYQKIDGSLIKFWIGRDGELRISSNGMIDIKDVTTLGMDGRTYSFYELIIQAVGEEGVRAIFNYLKGREGACLMCELVSPHNRIVVQYDQAELFLLSERNSKGVEELELLDSGKLPFLRRPKRVNALDLNKVLSLCAEIDPLKEEGFVVVDDLFHRVKVKSQKYIEIHHNLSVKTLSTKKLIQIIREGEVDEVLTYAPDLKERIDSIYKRVDSYADEIVEEYNSLLASNPFIDNRGDFARLIQKRDALKKSLFFQLYNGKGENLKEFILMKVNLTFLCRLCEEISLEVL